MAIPGWLAQNPHAIYTHHQDATDGVAVDWPDWLPSDCVDTIQSAGIQRPWNHQRAIADLAYNGHHVAASTATASGKTLAYLMPVMADWLNACSGNQLTAHKPAQVSSRAGVRAFLGLRQEPTALYLSPTKALAHDQLRMARLFGPNGWPVIALDGDSTSAERQFAREQASFILTNPDMLHNAMLAYHDRWIRFLSGLRYVVVDEAHRYRGVFGAHISSVIRRLRRLCHMYGASPIFIMSSATASNAGASGAQLIGETEPIDVIDKDFSPRPAQDVVLWQPEQDLMADATRLFSRLIDDGLKTIAFVQSKAWAELMPVQAREHMTSGRSICSYRSGYLARDRRQIEQGLQSGELFGVAATNALELGVDISGLDAVIICGFPGSLASLRQQIGRSGRVSHDGLAVIVQGNNPLDAYLFSHPKLMFEAPIERVVLDPSNPHILGPHLAAAAQEAPLTAEDVRWFGPEMMPTCARLCAAGLLKRRQTGWYWPRAEHAAAAIDLRGAGGKPVDIVEHDTGHVVGQVGLEAADHNVYPGAIYLHQGEKYLVDSLDLEQRQAFVSPSDARYFTQPRILSDAHIIAEQEHKSCGSTSVFTGDITINSQVTGYLRRDETSGQVWDENPLDLPAHHMTTKAVWWTVPNATIAQLAFSAVKLGNAAHAIEHTAIGLLPLFCPCDRWDIGGISMVLHPDTNLCTIMVHDGPPGGSGFARAGYDHAQEWLEATLQRLLSCTCSDGCPACTVSPKCGNANQHLDKLAAIELLTALL